MQTSDCWLWLPAASSTSHPETPPYLPRRGPAAWRYPNKPPTMRGARAGGQKRVKMHILQETLSQGSNMVLVAKHHCYPSTVVAAVLIEIMTSVWPGDLSSNSHKPRKETMMQNDDDSFVRSAQHRSQTEHKSECTHRPLSFGKGEARMKRIC